MEIEIYSKDTLGALKQIPDGFWHARMYRTDDEHVLHLHDDMGNTMDIRAKMKEEPNEEITKLKTAIKQIDKEADGLQEFYQKVMELCL